MVVFQVELKCERIGPEKKVGVENLNENRSQAQPVALYRPAKCPGQLNRAVKFRKLDERSVFSGKHDESKV